MATSEPTISTPAQWLESAGYSPDYRLRPLAGGDINDTSLLTTACGQRFCLKQNAAAAPDFFAAEAAGLAALAEAASGLVVPRVLCAARRFILMEYLEPGTRKEQYWEKLGEGLARLHSAPRPYFGFTGDNYCGLTPQPNPPTADGYQFFAEQRLLFQAKLALDASLLNDAAVKKIETLAAGLEHWIPEQAPALLHGDLWAGNIHCDPQGKPALIDPAAYYGWPEAELAMTLLFGGFSERFYESYSAHRPLEAGWRERAPLYNLYPLLNHLNLFGGGYHRQVVAILERYV